MIVTQGISKSVPADRKNFIMHVLFSVTSLCILKPTQQNFINVAEGLMSIVRTLTPMHYKEMCIELCYIRHSSQ